MNFRNYFKSSVFAIVSAGLFVLAPAHAGSYEDFFRAIKRNDEKAIQQLLSRGFDANLPDEYGRPGLLIAISEPSERVYGVLARWPGTNVNALNSKGESALMLASLEGQLDLAKVLIARGADVNKTGWTPLHYAASKGQLPLIRLLIENHAYIDAQSPNGTTPLMMAAMYGTGAAVKLLIDEGADATLKNQAGLNALQFAQDGSRPDAIELLGNLNRPKPAVAAVPAPRPARLAPTAVPAAKPVLPEGVTAIPGTNIVTGSPVAPIGPVAPAAAPAMADAVTREVPAARPLQPMPPSALPRARVGTTPIPGSPDAAPSTPPSQSPVRIPGW
ncbi:MAG: hypothetical protein EOO28_23830 [Comamonadaceae bacterium]|nr:MAG: hypothetical protein EOO28_23830 [Comamonadaceae bacterium]